MLKAPNGEVDLSIHGERPWTFSTENISKTWGEAKVKALDHEGW